MHPDSLPRLSSAVDRAPAARAATRAADVLFVSPDASLCAAVVRALGARYRVRTASHSGHALLVSISSHVEVLVSELCMPDVSGPALAERLRRHHPGLRALYLANPGTPEGLENVLVRPFTRDDLADRIERALGQP